MNELPQMFQSFELDIWSDMVLEDRLRAIKGLPPIDRSPAKDLCEATDLLMRGLTDKGYTVYKTMDYFKSLPQRILVCVDVSDIEDHNAKVDFYELANQLKLPYQSGHCFQLHPTFEPAIR